MTDMQNKISVDFSENDSLKESLTGKKVGDEVSVEIKFMIDSLTDEGMVGTIKTFAPEGYEPPGEPSADETEEGVEPDTKSPVAVLISGKRGAKE